MFEPLTHCPDCGAEAIFKFGRYTTECPCGVHLHVNGKVGRVCEFCKKRHWSDKAALFCKQYLLWYKNRDLIPTWLEEGTKDPRPLYMEGILWGSIRDAVMKRDNKRCTECGEEAWALAVHHIVPRAWDGTEHPRNLRVMCDICHLKLHQKMHVARNMLKTAMTDEAQQKLNGNQVCFPQN